MLAAVLGALPVDCAIELPADVPADVDLLVEEPALAEESTLIVEELPAEGGPTEESAALPEGWSLMLFNPRVDPSCWITPPDDGGPPPAYEWPSDESQFVGWDWCGTDELNVNWSRDVLAQYKEFVAQNPTWPEEHGAGGIQLMVITPSQHLPWIELSTPGEAKSFDAWYEDTHLRIDLDDPLLPIDDGPEAVEDGDVLDGEFPLEGDAPILVVCPGVPTPDEPIDLFEPEAAPTADGGVSASAGTSAPPLSDALWAWAVFGSSQAGAEMTAVTPLVGRRRSR